MKRRDLLVALAISAAPVALHAAEKPDTKKKKSGGASYVPIDTTAPEAAAGC